MTFEPLQNSTQKNDPVVDAEMQKQRSCSPRSMYSLATAVSVSRAQTTLDADAFKSLGSTLSRRVHYGTSNPSSPLRTSHENSSLPLLQGGYLISNICHSVCSFSHAWTSSSHKEVMDMEIQFLLKDSKSLMKHMQRMASGEAPLFSTTLSLVYDRLIEKAFGLSIPSGSGFVKSIQVYNPAPSLPPSSTFSVSSSSTPNSIPPSNVPALAPEPEPQSQPQPQVIPSSTAAPWALLQCTGCGKTARLQDIHGGARCPRCPPSVWDGRPSMQCQLCGALKLQHRDECARKVCGARFL